MIMADVLKIFLLVVGSLLVMVSYWLATEALFPAWTARCQRHYEHHPVRITLLGLVLGGPLLALGLSLAGTGGLAQLVGFACGSTAVLIGLVGATGLGRKIGCGLPTPADEHGSWRRVLRGGSVLALLFLLPFVGWFAVLPLTLASGFGAAVTTLWRARRGTAPATPQPAAVV